MAKKDLIWAQREYVKRKKWNDVAGRYDYGKSLVIVIYMRRNGMVERMNMAACDSGGFLSTKITCKLITNCAKLLNVRLARRSFDGK